MKKIFTLLVTIFFVNSISTAQTYQNAESAEYDPINNRWLVSNGSRIISDDGAGNLSYFGVGGATHGMEVVGNILFAVDGGAVRAYDLDLEILVGFVNIPGAQFLNGLTNDGNGNLYVTDFGAQKIHKINASDFNNMTSEEIVSDTQGTPNGVVYDGENNRLVVVFWSFFTDIKAVDLTDNSLSTILSTNLGNIDGIDEDNDGNYYISSWSPNAQISKFDKDFANPLEVISTPFINNPADIGYSLETDTLAIPIGNDVVFVGFETEDSTTAVTNLSADDLGFKIFPNPVSDQSYIQFELEQNEDLNLQILDQQGRVIRTLLKGQQSPGIHKILFAGHDLADGVYYCRLRIKNSIVTQKVIFIN